MTANQMTKKELIEKINDLASKYLGFETGIAGLRSRNVADLEKMAADFTRMMEFKKAAETIKIGKPKSWLTWVSLSGDRAPLADRQAAWDWNWNTIQAGHIWLNGTNYHLEQHLNFLGPRPGQEK